MDQLEKQEEDKITITLRHDESLVLFELLTRWQETKNEATVAIEHPAERRVLWDIQASLESVLDDVLAHDYGERLSRARSKVQDPE